MTPTSDPSPPGETAKNPLQEKIYALRREADLFECEMRGIELGVFLFEKQSEHLKNKAQADEIGELKAALGRERAERCVCKCDDNGDFVSQCLSHKEVENERDALRDAMHCINGSLIVHRERDEPLDLDAIEQAVRTALGYPPETT
jgi:hypothetical protein